MNSTCVVDTESTNTNHFHMCVHAKSLQSCPILCDPMDCIACLAPLSMEFYRQEYWRWAPFPRPGDLSNLGMELKSLTSPALAGGFFTTTPPGKPLLVEVQCLFSYLG